MLPTSSGPSGRAIRHSAPPDATKGALPLAHLRVRCSDVDEHAACLTNWNQRYDQLGAGRFTSEFEEFRFESVQLFCEIMNQPIHQSGLAWPGSLTVAVPISMKGRGWFNGAEYDANSMLLVHEDCQFDFRTPCSLNMVACAVDAGRLAAYAQRVEHRDLEAELAGQVMIPATPETIRRFGRLVVATMDELRARPGLVSCAAAREEMRLALYDAIIDASLPANVPLEQQPQMTGRGRRRIAMRARDYMLAHIDEPLTVARICSELRIPRRTLQYSFEDVFGLSPVRVLRALRLNGVRRALQQSPLSDCMTIGDIAAQWGFWHLSHFSAVYKAQFGELPSQALQRRP